MIKFTRDERMTEQDRKTYLSNCLMASALRELADEIMLADQPIEYAEVILDIDWEPRWSSRGVPYPTYVRSWGSLEDAAAAERSQNAYASKAIRDARQARQVKEREEEEAKAAKRAKTTDTPAVKKARKTMRALERALAKPAAKGAKPRAQKGRAA